MKNLIFIAFILASCTVSSQTSTSTLVMDSTNIEKDSGFVNVRSALSYIYKKLPSVGQGGTVIQLTNKSTAVTLNTIKGRITMSASALAAGAEVSFTLNNSFITTTDAVILNIQSGGNAGAYSVDVGSVSNGSCTITVSNLSTGSLSQALVLNFLIIK